jgi:DDE superfamily endonuclease
MIATKAVMDSLPEDAGAGPVAVLSRFRRDFHACLTARADELSELADAVLCADGPVRTLAGLSLAPEHRRGRGALYDAVNHGRIDIVRLRRSLAGLPLPQAADGRAREPEPQPRASLDRAEQEQLQRRLDEQVREHFPDGGVQRATCCSTATTRQLSRETCWSRYSPKRPGKTCPCRPGTGTTRR